MFSSLYYGVRKSSCLDGSGNPKNRYDSLDEAEDMRDYLEEENGVYLRVYACPDCGCWHLTKRLW